MSIIPNFAHTRLFLGNIAEVHGAESLFSHSPIVDSRATHDNRKSMVVDQVEARVAIPNETESLFSLSSCGFKSVAHDDRESMVVVLTWIATTRASKCRGIRSATSNN